MLTVVITRFAAILASVLISAVLFVRVNGQIPVIAGPEKAQIVESVLQLEKKLQDSEFVNFKQLATDNVEFLSAEQISKLGFSSLPAEEINRLKVEHVINYVRITSVTYLREGVVVVKLSRVSEGRPCFSGPFHREDPLTYEFTKNLEFSSERWVGRLKGRPLPFTLPRILSSAQ